ncbi:MAG: EF-P lysine aminoacylase GenX [Planctomycetaceae bacterium]|nr:EF-P lysine aminoacylase GenX [Planctomycetaceae bacterium]
MRPNAQGVDAPNQVATLRERARLTDHLRQWFREQNYWEVETPLLSRDCCIDAWLEPFSLVLDDGTPVYLQTSPEFLMKRLLCLGAERIFQITRSFRKDEVGAWHNPEFTIVEWYAIEETHLGQMDFVEGLVNSLRVCVGMEPLPPFVRLTYQQAFRDVLEVCPFEITTSDLRRLVLDRTTSRPSTTPEDRDDLLNLLLAECVEPRIAAQGAVFLMDYPASQSALARIRRDGGFAVAERFELYLDGIEICNGYHELTDAEELRFRMDSQNRKRLASGKPSLPVESQLLQLMEVSPFPPSAGVALGWDRLIAWLLGRDGIRDVLTFPFDQV